MLTVISRQEAAKHSKGKLKPLAVIAESHNWTLLLNVIRRNGVKNTHEWHAKHKGYSAARWARRSDQDFIAEEIEFMAVSLSLFVSSYFKRFN
jgi:hypothetical protein